MFNVNSKFSINTINTSRIFLCVISKSKKTSTYPFIPLCRLPRSKLDLYYQYLCSNKQTIKIKKISDTHIGLHRENPPQKISAIENHLRSVDVFNPRKVNLRKLASTAALFFFFKYLWKLMMSLFQNLSIFTERAIENPISNPKDTLIADREASILVTIKILKSIIFFSAEKIRDQILWLALESLILVKFFL